MFIIEPIRKEEATGELKLLYRMIEKSLGFVPPHFELFATIDMKAMKEFLEYNQYMMNHEKIDKNVLVFLRLYIAKKECRTYCTNFNTTMLLNMNIDNDIVENITQNIESLPLDKAQNLLLVKVLKALYSPEQFSKEDLQEVYKLGFSDKDYFDIVSYATNFMGKSKLIEAYLDSKV